MGHAISGVFVANPDPADFTTGVLPTRFEPQPFVPTGDVLGGGVLPRDFAPETRDWDLPLADDPLERGPFVQVPVLLAALRRRWRVWTATTVAGVLGAVLLSSTYAPLYTGTATVLVGHPSGSDPARNVVTDVELARTQTVAARAADLLGLGTGGAAELLGSVRSAAVSAELVKIKVDGPTDADAVKRVDAMATAFVAFRREQVGAQWKAAEAALKHRQEELSAELASVESRLDVLGGADPAVSPNVKGMAELEARRLAVNSQIANLNQQLEAGSFDTEAVVARTEVVDAGRSLGRPFMQSTGVNVVAGFILGLAAGAGWVIVCEITSDRPRRRGEISAALGVPVGLSVGRVRHWRMGGAPVWRIAGRLSAVLDDTGDGQQLVVVAADRARPAAGAVAVLALELGRQGRQVLVSDESHAGVLAPLLGAGDGRNFLVTSNGARAGDPRTLLKAADTVLTFATLDPAEGAHHLAGCGPAAVVVATAGRSTAVWLRSVADMVAGAGLELDSAVLVGADPRDGTVGLVLRRGRTSSVPAHWSGAGEPAGDPATGGRQGDGAGARAVPRVRGPQRGPSARARR